MKDQSEPQPPSDDSNGEEPVFIPPLFMALLHPEDYPQSVFIKALRPLWRSSTYQKIVGARQLVRQDGWQASIFGGRNRPSLLMVAHQLASASEVASS
jgi:hypothetical protein